MRRQQEVKPLFIFLQVLRTLPFTSPVHPHIPSTAFSPPPPLTPNPARVFGYCIKMATSPEKKRQLPPRVSTKLYGLQTNNARSLID